MNEAVLRGEGSDLQDSGFFVCFCLKNGSETAVLVPPGLLLGKEHHELTSTTPAAVLSPSASTASAGSAHAKTGSKDSSTQTDKSAELFWPSMASLPNRGRLSMTPSNSPILKHPVAKGTAEKPGMSFFPPFTLRKTIELWPERETLAGTWRWCKGRGAGTRGCSHFMGFFIMMLTLMRCILMGMTRVDTSDCHLNEYTA